MSTTPSILYRNLLALAELGRGDGTVYGSGTGATPSPSGKTFALSGFSSVLTNADDLFNGCVLHFPASGRSYLIVDWTAASDTATVIEVPTAADAGPCEIRRTLRATDAHPLYPVRHLADGRIYRPWQGSVANAACSIQVSSPNGVDGGGFEESSVTAWTSIGGSGGAGGRNATSPILGAADYKLAKGSSAYHGITQAVKIPLTKGKTYSVLLKASRDTGSSSDELTVRIINTVSGSAVGVAWDPDDTGDDAATSTTSWGLSLTGTAAWKSASFSPPDDYEAGDLTLEVKHTPTGSNAAYVDEISLFERILPNTLVVAGHNWMGGLPSSEANLVRGCRCPSDRTGFGTGDHADLVAYDSPAISGRGTIWHPFTAGTAAYPIYEIRLGAQAGRTWEVGETSLGERWDWSRFLSGDWAPWERDVESNVVRSRGGTTVIEELSRRRTFGGSVGRLAAAEAAKWKAFAEDCAVSAPFFWKGPAFTTPGISEEVLMLRMEKPAHLQAVDGGVRWKADYQFEEVR